jgi:hypothetical protein
MKWPQTLFLSFFLVGLLMLSSDVRGFGTDMLTRAHDAFVVVFVDAANFVRGCF